MNESGLEVEELRERAYWEVWQNMKYLYGPKGFNDFYEFCNWLDHTFKTKETRNES